MRHLEGPIIIKDNHFGRQIKESRKFPGRIQTNDLDHYAFALPLCSDICKQQYFDIRFLFFKFQSPQFKCKKKGNCALTTANRRRCQHCRYNRCIRWVFSPMGPIEPYLGPGAMLLKFELKTWHKVTVIVLLNKIYQGQLVVPMNCDMG